MKRNVCRVAAVLVGAALVAAATASAQSQPAPAAEPPPDVADEYRITGFPSYRINDAWSGFGYLGWVCKPDAGYTSYYLGKGFLYSPAKWVHIWGGLIGVFTDSTVKSNSLELRPFIGPKFLGSNRRRWRYFNGTRHELRLTETLDTDD